MGNAEGNALQKRAIATRQAVVAAAAEVFNRLGYVKAGLQEIISESGVTKGSLYFHFSSKEQLARAVIDEGCANLESACSQQFDSRTPALETLIGISYVMIHPSNNDDLVLAAFRLLNEMGDFRGTGTWSSINGSRPTRHWRQGQSKKATSALTQIRMRRAVCCWR